MKYSSNKDIKRPNIGEIIRVKRLKVLSGTGLIYGIVANSKTRVRCVFCGVFIPKATKCIEQHTNGAQHKGNIELMSENGISFANNILHCRPCNLNLPDEQSGIDHIEGDDHGNWMAALDDLVDGEYISLDRYLSSESDDVYCEVCFINVNASLEKIEEHVNSLSHRQNVVEHLKPLNGIFSVENEDEVWCKVCDVYIDNNVQSILSHMDDDERHMDWLMEIEDLIDNHEVSIKSYLANEHDTYAFCNKCQMQVTCNAQAIENHVNSDAHLSQFDL
ncbi:hypothetical protein K1T71_011766 [Dendrolimus kikuchii]|uniref:Uncharacterized protein n=1 Tax=Dendrolimus kikuchii TaxID=765133 RepID=A0ACC1CMB0_9NEOP|nr:hypothetical protein K1T71_011766 [Dendrolimus kikuchii]